MITVPLGILTTANAPSPPFGDVRTSKKSLMNEGSSCWDKSELNDELGDERDEDDRASSSGVAETDRSHAFAGDINLGDDGGDEFGVGS
jgi:hypothetical protein